MLRRLARRLLGGDPPSPPSQPPPRPMPAAASAGGVEPQVSSVGLPGLIAALQPRGRPRLVVHWASWDALSTAGLPVVHALVAGLRGVDVVGVVWDEALDAPTGRIPGMAQRPARWAGGDQAEAWLRQVGIEWPHLVYAGDFEAMFDALGLEARVVPQVVWVGGDGEVLARHVGAFEGEGWEGFVGRGVGVA